MTTADQRLSSALDKLEANNTIWSSFLTGDAKTTVTAGDVQFSSLAKLTADIQAKGLIAGGVTNEYLADTTITAAKLDTSLAARVLPAAIGTNGQVLTSNGTKAAWGALPATPKASTTVSGIVELATNAEATAGTDTARAVTPAGLRAASPKPNVVTNTYTASVHYDTVAATLTPLTTSITIGQNSRIKLRGILSGDWPQGGVLRLRMNGNEVALGQLHVTYPQNLLGYSGLADVNAFNEATSIPLHYTSSPLSAGTYTFSVYLLFNGRRSFTLNTTIYQGNSGNRQRLVSQVTLEEIRA